MNKKQKTERMLEVEKLYLENLNLFARIDIGFNFQINHTAFAISDAQKEELKLVHDQSKNFREFLGWVEWDLRSKVDSYFIQLEYEYAALKKSLENKERGLKQYHRDLIMLPAVEQKLNEVQTLNDEFNNRMTDFMGNLEYFDNYRLQARSYWRKLVDAEEEEESVLDRIDLFFVQLKFDKYGYDFSEAMKDLFEGEHGYNRISPFELNSILSEEGNADKLLLAVKKIQELKTTGLDIFEQLKESRHYLNSFLIDVGERIDVKTIKIFGLRDAFTYETIGLGVKYCCYKCLKSKKFMNYLTNPKVARDGRNLCDNCAKNEDILSAEELKEIHRKFEEHEKSKNRRGLKK